MAAWQKMGIICINSEIQGVCQQCLWLEWNPVEKHCRNELTVLCLKRTGQQTDDLTDRPHTAARAPLLNR